MYYMIALRLPICGSKSHIALSGRLSRASVCDDNANRKISNFRVLLRKTVGSPTCIRQIGINSPIYRLSAVSDGRILAPTLNLPKHQVISRKVPISTLRNCNHYMGNLPTPDVYRLSFVSPEPTLQILSNNITNRRWIQCLRDSQYHRQNWMDLC